MRDEYLGQTPITERLFNLAEQALPIYERQRVLKAQLEQARAGRPPIDVSQMRTPAVPVEVSLKPGLSPQMMTGLAVGAGVLLLAFVLRRRKG